MRQVWGKTGIIASQLLTHIIPDSNPTRHNILFLSHFYGHSHMLAAWLGLVRSWLLHYQPIHSSTIPSSFLIVSLMIWGSQNQSYIRIFMVCLLMLRRDGMLIRCHSFQILESLPTQICLQLINGL